MGGREAKACFVSQVFGCAALLRAGARVPGAGDRAGAFGLPGAIGRVRYKTEDAPLIKAGRLPGRWASLYYGYI